MGKKNDQLQSLRDTQAEDAGERRRVAARSAPQHSQTEQQHRLRKPQISDINHNQKRYLIFKYPEMYSHQKTQSNRLVKTNSGFFCHNLIF